ncbi:MAG: hypothetical protein ACOY3P_08785 [Planctomycetota bacterium]
MNLADDEPRLPPPKPAPRRNRWWSILFSLVIFLSGLIVGGAVALSFVKNQLVMAVQNPEFGPIRITNMLKRSLRLTPEQAEEILAIMHKRQGNLQAIRIRVQPEVEAELEAVESEVAAVLDSQQRERWAAMVTKLKATWLPPMPERQADVAVDLEDAVGHRVPDLPTSD